MGRAHFETAHKRFTILDAPGHKSYVPNMISGASQADVGVLIVSARKGEFETGFEKGGQTGEHALLARTLGVGKLVIAINKMDDPSVGWKKERYDEIEGKIRPFLKTSCLQDWLEPGLVPVPSCACIGSQNSDSRVPRARNLNWMSNPAGGELSIPPIRGQFA